MDMTMTDPKQDVQDVRAQFEAWRESQPCRETPFPYDIALLSWQAALQSPAVRELVEAARKVCSDNSPALSIPVLAAALRTLGAGHVE